MNTKTIIKIAFFLIIGSVVGAIITLILSSMSLPGFFTSIWEAAITYNHYLYVLLMLLVYLPTRILYFKAKKNLLSLDETVDEEIEWLETKSYRMLDLALTLNGSFAILNLLIFGISFTHIETLKWLVVLIFMLNTVLTSTFEIIAIRFIQKHDSRLKGDPTTLRFAKDYIESCDEAEKLRIYRSGYKAFSATKWAAFALFILSILTNIIFSTGAYPIVIVGTLLLISTIMYTYYSRK